jgi:hypothetical protein
MGGEQSSAAQLTEGPYFEGPSFINHTQRNVNVLWKYRLIWHKPESHDVRTDDTYNNSGAGTTDQQAASQPVHPRELGSTSIQAPGPGYFNALRRAPTPARLQQPAPATVLTFVISNQPLSHHLSNWKCLPVTYIRRRPLVLKEV